MPRTLVSIIGVITVAGVVAWAAFSAPLRSTNGSPGAGYGYGGKVVICHHTHSKKHPFVTIVVSQSAVAAHLAHGDTLGACPTLNTHKHHGSHRSDAEHAAAKSKAHQVHEAKGHVVHQAEGHRGHK